MSNQRHAFSRTDLCACIFVVGLFAIVLLPALGITNEKSDLALCAKNLRGIWIGFESYGVDYDNVLPPASVGPSEIPELRNIMYFLWPDYVPDNETFHCPADNAYWDEAMGRQSYSYWYELGWKKQKIHEPVIDLPLWYGLMDFHDLGKAVIIHDGEPWISRDGIYYGFPGYTRHFESKLENCLYLDGHVAARDTHWPDASPMNWWVGPMTWRAR